ncbi:hypothetical protein NG798_08370 [Ancylothrix sp. C2]|uniref:hypothetical protein n=1 Tax=Ancylothrix sp. D3o TaxID=2953691 RepID=UPI0021BAE727|nr:hypothetical protein [Ancylothrix sp. D3o]MCT7949800.1 hypothetical protein [Ancylothrix sp. D3o]
MKLDIKPTLNGQSPFYPLSEIKEIWQEKFEPNTWVKLLDVPSAYSFDEALLLCGLEDDRWVVWIPDHGEAVLHTGQFLPVLN